MVSLSSDSLQLFGNYLENKLKVAIRNPRERALVRCKLKVNSVPLRLSHVSAPRKADETCGFLRSKSSVDVSTFNRMIKEYTDGGLFEKAIGVYVSMLECGFPVEEFRFFPCLVKAFGGLCDVKKGKQIHGQLLKLGALGDLYIKNSILSMYWKCEADEDSVKMFEKMHGRDLVSWNTMISGCCQSGNFVYSLEIFRMMIREGGVMYPDGVACHSALLSSASLESLCHGREIHGFIMKNGLDSDEFLVSGLIEMYMNCGAVKNAERVFRGILNNESQRENIVLWNVMILGYVTNKCPSLAFELFVEMFELGINVDSSTVVVVLVLCSQLLDLAVGKQMHRIIISFGLEKDIRVGTALMEMYFKCGDPANGLQVFRRTQNCNIVMWGSVISNCAQSGYSYEALQLFHDFLMEYGFPDSTMILAALRACSSLALKTRGVEIHGLAIKLGIDSDVFVGSALVDLYGKCGDMESAQEVFYGLSTKDLISWNALISGFAQNDCPYEALRASRDMQSEEIKPNTVTLACVLSVCTHLSVMILCKAVHCYILRHGFEANILVNNSLINAYAKCGDICSSRTVFRGMPARDEISWNSIMLGFGMHGKTDDMFSTFENMKAAGVKPDHATFTALLSACSHTGKVDMGLKYLDSMIEDYNLEPQVEHYTCLVDLLGRAGHLKQAYNLILTMPCSPDDRIWGSLLGSCKIHGDAELAETVANHIFKIDPTNVGYRVLLANLYKDSDQWNEVTQIRSEMKHIGLQKQPGCSWIEVDNNVHTFVAGDCSHEQSEAIYAVMEMLILDMKRAGYIPRLRSANSDPVTND